MLIVLKKSVTKEQVDKICLWLEQKNLGYLHCESSIGIETVTSDSIQSEIIDLEGVEKILRINTPYKLASIEAKSKTIIRAKDVEIGGDRIIVMAGPCAIESPEQLQSTADALKKGGVQLLRGSAYKPRSSPYSFQGMGEEGLKIHKEAQAIHQMAIITEVMNVNHMELVAAHVDILQIGARNMQNYDLLKAAGRANKPVILKRGLCATIEEWLLSAEYILAHGNPNVILCERGIRTYETATRNTLDISSIPVLKRLTHLPVIVDPSHAAGRVDLIEPLSKAAIAVGADGLLIEVHYNPKMAKCDGKQSLSPEGLIQMLPKLSKVAAAVGRSL